MTLEKENEKNLLFMVFSEITLGLDHEQNLKAFQDFKSHQWAVATKES